MQETSWGGKNIMNGIILCILLFIVLVGLIGFTIRRHRYATKSISKEAQKELKSMLFPYTRDLLFILLALCTLGYALHEVQISKEAQQHLQEISSYETLQNTKTSDYQLVVLDGKWEKDVRYYSKKYHSYRYYCVKPDLSYKEVFVTETCFSSDRYKYLERQLNEGE